MAKDFLFFFGIVIAGVFIEVLFSQFHYLLTKKHMKHYHFSFGRYIFLMLFPLIATILLTVSAGATLIKMFIAFAVIGTFFEWLIGYSYHMVVGQRLWTYHRLGLSGYTSLLSIPLWGFAGAVFYLLARVFV